jgi:hypothetical protein
MTHYDADMTQTDWNEFEQHNNPARRKGDQSTAAYMPGASPDDAMAGQNAKGSGRSNAKLVAMFNKFLYQR